MSAGALVHLTIDKGIGVITLDSPHNRNALSAQLKSELRAHVDRALADDAVRVIVLTHTGTVFCAGADLKESAQTVADQPPSGDDLVEVLEALWTSPKPVVGRLTGAARAGGLGLVAVCDLVVAAQTVTFAFSEVRLGVIPAVISVPLRRRIAPQALRRLFLTGEVFDATTAAAVGLISDAVPVELIDADVERLLGMLVLGAPDALSQTKNLLAVELPSIRDELLSMLVVSRRHFTSDEGREGMTAFAEKRPASWVPRPTS